MVPYPILKFRAGQTRQPVQHYDTIIRHKNIVVSHITAKYCVKFPFESEGQIFLYFNVSQKTVALSRVATLKKFSTPMCIIFNLKFFLTILTMYTFVQCTAMKSGKSINLYVAGELSALEKYIKSQ